MNERIIQYAHSLRLDPYPSPDYRICSTHDDIEEYFSDNNFSATWLAMFRSSDWLLPNYALLPLGCDTESLPDGSPFCLTFSHTPGTGRLVYARDHDLIDYYRRKVSSISCLQIFHYWLHDAPVFEQLSLPSSPFYDTMVRAYILCLGGGGDDEEESRAGRGSLGLKQLCYRHCNMRMRNFKDVVWPHSIPHVLKWLWSGEQVYHRDEWVTVCECGHPPDAHAPHAHAPRGKTGKLLGACACPCRRYKSTKRPPRTDEDKFLDGIYTKITNLIFDLESHQPGIDPWKRVKQWDLQDQEAVESSLGPIPRPSVAYVPEPELLNYAVADADGALRLYLKMLDMKPWIFYD